LSDLDDTGCRYPNEGDGGNCVCIGGSLVNVFAGRSGTRNLGMKPESCAPIITKRFCPSCIARREGIR
jgi:hypothetical protein